MARVQAALPASVEELSLTCCEQLESVHPRISALTQLQRLELRDNKELRSLPDLSALTQLRSLNLYHCHQLRSLPDLSKLTQLECLILADCGQLRSLPKLPPQLPWNKIQSLPQHLEQEAITEEQDEIARADRERIPSARPCGDWFWRMTRCFRCQTTRWSQLSA